MPASSSPAFRVLVLGGYGNFGSLIVRRLGACEGIQVLVAGRDRKRAEDLARETGGEAVCLDMNQPTLAGRLAELRVNLVICAAGPVRHRDYRVARAAVEARAHYLDLADSRAFVCNIGQLDRLARSAGVLVCAGAASLPALSAAVVDHLLPRFSRLDSISHGISWSARIPGLATLVEALDCCGKPLRQWRQGRWQEVYGWQGLRRHRFAAPLGRRWLAWCDAPDLELFPQRYAGVRDVQFASGQGSGLAQVGAWALAWLVRSGLLRSVAPYCASLQRMARVLQPLGSGRSGMFVCLHGEGDDGRPLALCWELLASAGHGSSIPASVAVALARQLASGRLARRGAMPCVGLLGLDDYLAELDGLQVRQLTREI
ncbi:saccharopine dehydrogenase family protein [Pseudomonas jinjuensis]|uniref:Saccharopine dehydrogenase, NADP-dependent n=1 Tax=Pseudomonas jinjuensis TaxID=198616 RepID=A0A1H0DFK1_9PSED|nr:saccharopine dehydrogenase NADP-binding domain-containing protein [Pseudomonas jinjuensis]SDN68878.1 Saccharopine dehydrogenase, NADP-dependent [Pseudomonas jinjuensis]